ncbi:unnamed protein product [Rotaria sp. Silwood1]|nr:unnamed protein product [Rotaria sp. Silwood1]
MFRSFFTNNTFKQIENSFVLVTHNSDELVPTNRYKWALDDPRILAWFTQNPDREHKKLFAIPIGIPNVRWSHGNLTIFKKAIKTYRKPFFQRSTLLYANFEVGTNLHVRSKALAWALNFTNVRRRARLPLEIYLKEVGNTKFVLSPPGSGLDCHRTWEALLMGAVPIVLRSQLDTLFMNESVLIVDNWKDVTLDRLMSLKYRASLSRKLSAEYWYERLTRAAGRSSCPKLQL